MSGFDYGFKYDVMCFIWYGVDVINFINFVILIKLNIVKWKIFVFEMNIIMIYVLIIIVFVLRFGCNIIILKVRNIKLRVGNKLCLKDVINFCCFVKNFVKKIIIVNFINFDGWIENVLILI